MVGSPPWLFCLAEAPLASERECERAFERVFVTMFCLRAPLIWIEGTAVCLARLLCTFFTWVLEPTTAVVFKGKLLAKFPLPDRLPLGGR